MSGTSNSTMTAGELLDRYIELSIQQGTAIDLSDGSQINRLGSKIFRINDELKSRSGDQRRILFGLLSHQNPYVRYNAATSLIRIFPVEARNVLQTIADSKWYPLAGHAGMYLHMLDTRIVNWPKPGSAD
uniref:DUF2019 domain-containing protein n=1 Tax=Rhodopseudomonas palustris (strain BisA53) TaxID=316055 RepID=Q07QC9_RHOP5